MIDKEIERLRYDERSKRIKLGSAQRIRNTSGLCGAGSIRMPLRAPYLSYEEIICRCLGPGMDVLEIGSGTGEFTGALVRTGARVTASDISLFSLEVLSLRYEGAENLRTEVCDMEKLPFPDSGFDVVTSAGSLSYGQNERVMHEIFRVLKPHGAFICVDSLNHNPVYRINRYVHYLRGERTLGTLQRMPTVGLIKRYQKLFGSADVKFYGGISWLVPFLTRLVGDRYATRFSDFFDQVFHVRKSAFKFVLIARKTN